MLMTFKDKKTSLLKCHELTVNLFIITLFKISLRISAEIKSLK